MHLIFCDKIFAIYLVGKHPPHKRRIHTTHEDTPSANSTFSNGSDNSEVQFYHLNTVDESLEKQFGIRREQRAPCSCFELNCGCCAGMQFRKFKRQRKSAGDRSFESFQFIQNEFSFSLNFSLFQFHLRPE